MINKFFISFIKIDLNNINKRIDNFLFKNIKSLPKNKIYSLIRKGNIRINKKRISHKYKLKLNDIIRIPLINFKKKRIYINNYIIEKFKKYIIYEDKYILIINKPYGISVHGGYNIILNIIDIYRNILNNNYLELVHRIDKNTSGILIMSKNINYLRILNNYFKNKKIKKKYICLTHGIWPKNILKIENYIIKEKFNRYISSYP